MFLLDHVGCDGVPGGGKLMDITCSLVRLLFSGSLVGFHVAISCCTGTVDGQILDCLSCHVQTWVPLLVLVAVVGTCKPPKGLRTALWCNCGCGRIRVMSMGGRMHTCHGGSTCHIDADSVQCSLFV